MKKSSSCVKNEKRELLLRIVCQSFSTSVRPSVAIKFNVNIHGPLRRIPDEFGNLFEDRVHLNPAHCDACAGIMEANGHISMYFAVDVRVCQGTILML